MAALEKSMVSYSASFEDVILQRALQGVQQGCYVDVGASHPLIDSNTASFYNRGWRGICIEPLTYLNPFWAHHRPEDILINAVIGAAAGQTTLYYYAGTSQISTCSVETMEHWKSYNKLSDEERAVPMLTLNRVMEEFLDERAIHLLSIDAEGSEKQVLQGFDLKKYHPWIIIIEATVPGTHIPSHQAWEHDVLAAGYTMVLYDGINRFYLSNQQSELQQHFVLPPNVWDVFIPYQQELAEKKLEELKNKNEELIAEIETLRKIIEGSVTLPANFWDYTPHADDIERQHKLIQLQEENTELGSKVKALQQSIALNDFLNK